MTEPVFYKFSDSWSESGSVTVDLTRYLVIKETPQGYWVTPEWAYNSPWAQYRDDHKRWTAKQGSRYCQPSFEEAKQSYWVRKSCELRHIQTRLDKCKHVLAHFAEIAEGPLTRDLYLDLGQPGLE